MFLLPGLSVCVPAWSWVPPGRRTLLPEGFAHSAYGSYGPADLGGKPPGIMGREPCHISHSEGHDDWWLTNCFVLSRSLFGGEKRFCLFWSFLHLLNEDSSACCVDPGSGDAGVTRERSHPSATPHRFWQREEREVLGGGSTSNTNRCWKRLTRSRVKISVVG